MVKLLKDRRKNRNPSWSELSRGKGGRHAQQHKQTWRMLTQANNIKLDQHHGKQRKNKVGRFAFSRQSSCHSAVTMNQQRLNANTLTETLSRGSFHCKEQQKQQQQEKKKISSGSLRWVGLEWRVAGGRGIVSRRLELMDISYLSCRACSTHSNRLLQQEDLVFIWLAAWRAWNNRREGTGLEVHWTHSIRGCRDPPLTKTMRRSSLSHLMCFGIHETPGFHRTFCW